MTNTEWIKQSMLGVYSEDLGRQLTEAEIRVQRALEKLPIPDWYRNYSRQPPKILKNDTPIESRPALWKSFKSKVCRRKSFKKAIKNRSPRSSPTNLVPVIASKSPQPVKELNNETYRVAIRTPKPSIIDQALFWSPSSDSDDCDSPTSLEIEADIHVSPVPNNDKTLILDAHDSFTSNAEKSTNLDSTLVKIKRTLNNSHTFPRVTPSRKIQNINIALPPRSPPKQPENPSVDKEPLYTTTVSIATSNNNNSTYESDSSVMPKDDTNATYNISSSLDTSNNTYKDKAYSTFFFNIEPKNVTVSTKVDLFAERAFDTSDSENETVPKRCSPSPVTRFFNSSKKSTTLEKIVQSKRKKNHSLIQEKISKLDRAVSKSCLQSKSFPRTMAKALEDSLCISDEQPRKEYEERLHHAITKSLFESKSFPRTMAKALDESLSMNEKRVRQKYEERCSYVSDSDLAKSTSISFGDSCSSGEEATITPLPSNDILDDDVFWIPAKMVDLPRTSSRLSRNSSMSTGGISRYSPGLSPIMMDKPDNSWGMTYNIKKQKAKKQLIKIDETGVADSGYSDKLGTNYSSKEKAKNSRSSSLESMSSSSSTPLSTSPTIIFEMKKQTKDTLSTSGPYVLHSFIV